MYQERETTDGEVAVANHDDRARILDTEISAQPEVKPLTLEWMGPRAFQSRYGVQPGVDRDFCLWWGARSDQQMCHHGATAASPTDLVYVYDLAWDEYAVLAIDVQASAVEIVINRALATDMHQSVEVFAGLLADHLSAPAPDIEPASGVASGVKL